VYREFKFGMFKPASDFTQNPDLREIVSASKIFVQGSIDLVIEGQNGDIIICDYKTDRISIEERSNSELLRSNMTKKHGEQLKQYKYAIEHIFNTSPKKLYIYSLPLGDVIEI
jgi:ATP-dependent helicase/nuclease subunit A